MPTFPFNRFGFRTTGATRIRQRWLLGPIVEEERQHANGAISWAPIEQSVQLTGRTPRRTDLPPEL